MKVKLIKDLYLVGVPVLARGSVQDFPTDMAKFLIEKGKAEKVNDTHSKSGKNSGSDKRGQSNRRKSVSKG